MIALPNGSWAKRFLGGLKEVALLFLVVAALATLLLAMPVLILVISVTQAVTRRRKLAALACTVCAVCGGGLPPDALDLADTAWHAEHPLPPGMRVRRVVRHLDAICPACGARYEWEGKHRQFRQVEGHGGTDARSWG